MKSNRKRSAQKKGVQPNSRFLLKLQGIRISELQRTILLLLLLAVAVSTMFYIQGNVDTNFVEQL